MIKSKNGKNIELNKFKHKIEERVKFHEVDLLGVCNNAVYFNYFEDGRLSYTQDLKKNYRLKKFLEGDSFFIMAHNNCDYFESAHLDDELYVYTRVSFVKNSSFGFDHIVQNKSTEKILAAGGGVVVHIDKSKQKPVRLPDEFYDAIKEYEVEVDILKDKS